MNLQKHIWEGWTVQNFIDVLQPSFNQIMNNNSWQKPFENKESLKIWLKNNQPHYKKNIPEVLEYFEKLRKSFQ